MIPLSSNSNPDLLNQAFLSGLKKRKIDVKFQYVGIQQSGLWLSLTESKSYSYFKNSQSLVDQIKKEISKDLLFEHNFIALGPGNGVKEIALFEELSKSQSASLFALDISEELLGLTKQKAEELSLSFQGFTCDLLTDLPKISEYIRDNFRPFHFFSMLGNTLGNYEINEILPLIRRSIRQGDFMLLGVAEYQGEGLSKVTHVDDRYVHSFGSFYGRVDIKPTDGTFEIEYSKHPDYYGIMISRQFFRLKKNKVVQFLGEEIEFESNERIEMGVSCSYSLDGLKTVLEYYDLKPLKTYYSKGVIK